MPPVAVDAEICHALLIDGTPVHIRPITPEDDERLVAFHNELSPESLYMRFFSAHPRLQPADRLIAPAAARRRKCRRSSTD